MSRSNLHAVRPGFDRMPPLCLSTRFLPTRKFQVMHLVLKNGLRGAFSTDKNTDLQNGRERERQRETYASKQARERRDRGKHNEPDLELYGLTVLSEMLPKQRF